MEIKLASTYKGTRILFGDLAKKKRDIIGTMISHAMCFGCEEIIFPVIQSQKSFESKVGGENLNLMFNFKDRGNRDITLAPEYTAIVQQLAKEPFKYKKDVKIFYIGECFRGEKPQAGRYRQFTQFGVEIINPTKNYTIDLLNLAMVMIQSSTNNYVVNEEAKRGLDYYTGAGFEISCPELGAQKQVCGGGAYEGGIGFAIGVDRILLVTKS